MYSTFAAADAMIKGRNTVIENPDVRITIRYAAAQTGRLIAQIIRQDEASSQLRIPKKPATICTIAQSRLTTEKVCSRESSRI